MNNASDFVIENGVLEKYTGVSEEVIVPEGVIEIGAHAFHDCTHVKQVTFPSSTRKIADGHWAGNAKSKFLVGTFFGCENLVSVSLPEMLIEIGTAAFARCQKLKEINIPDSVKRIGGGAFYGCDELADPDGFVVIRNVLYHYNGDKLELSIPQGIIEISHCAFKSSFSCDHSKIQKIILPDSLVQIGHCAWEGCRSIKEMVIPQSITAIPERAFANCDLLERIILPTGLSQIERYAFHNCWSLKKLQLPQGLTQIGCRAFLRCGIEEIEAGDQLQLIDEYAFEDCSHIKSISIPMKKEDIESIWPSATKYTKERTLGFCAYRQAYNDPIIVNEHYKYFNAQKKKLLPILIKTNNTAAIRVCAEAGCFKQKAFLDETIASVPKSKKTLIKLLESF